MADVEDRVSGERERQDGECLARLAEYRDGGDEEKTGRQRDVEADAEPRRVHRGEADIRPRRQGQQQRGELAEAQLTDQSFWR